MIPCLRSTLIGSVKEATLILSCAADMQPLAERRRS